MRVKIVLGFLVTTALVAVVLGLLWTKTLNADRDISTYFSDEHEIYMFYRPSECSPQDLQWEINGLKLFPFIASNLSEGKWKSALVQKVDDKKYTLAFEQNSSFRDEYLDTLCKSLGIQIERNLMQVRDINEEWTIRNINNFILITNTDNPDKSESRVADIIQNRDKNASFACIIEGELQEYYCFPSISKFFTREKIENLIVNSIGSMDFSFYNVVPKNVPFFEYLDRDLLLHLYPEWQESPLIEYVESGLIFSNLNNVDFYVFPISDLFSAKEILESVAGELGENNANIKALMKVVPRQNRSYAIAIENNLILSSSQEILESISLSYQMQAGFNTTRKFELMMRNSSAKVHHRWYNRQQLFKASKFSILPIQSNFGYSYFRNRDKTMRFVSIGNNSEQATENRNQGSEPKILWNFSLKNSQSSFHLNANQVVGVLNLSDRAFSIIDGSGNISTSITLEENVKSIHPLEKGFLVETFEKLYWIPEQNTDGIREYAFKGKIESTIAAYIWNSEEFITFISEQKLHKLSLKTGKIETIQIPVALSNSLPQLHAFNHKGKLNLGYFSDKNFHALEVSNNRWTKEAISGDVIYSEKIDGRIHFIEIVQAKGAHKILFGGEQQVLNAIKPNFAGRTKSQNEPVWILRNGRDFFVYKPKLIKGTLLTISSGEISGFEPVYSADRLAGMLVLDDVQNEVHYYRRTNEDIELNSSMKFRGSKFIKNIGDRKFITFVDGQLVAYEF